MASVRYRRKRQQWEIDARTLGRGRLLMPKGTTKEEATRQLAALVNQSGEEVAFASSKPPLRTTVADYAERFLAHCTEIQPSTLAGYRATLKYIIEAFGSEAVTALTSGRVMGFLAGLRTPTEKRPDGYSKNTVRLIRNVGRMLCDDAIGDGLLTSNPFHFRKGRRKQAGQLTRRDRTKKVRAMDAGQLSRFLAAAAEHESRLHPLFLTMARTGLRPGEALAVRWSDLDLATRTLHVRRALSLGEEGPTKTGEERDVHLSSALVDVLFRLRTERERETLKRGWREMPPWIFCTTAGTPYDPANVLKAMRRALRKAELPAFRVYDLRHTFATRLLDRGVPITYVSGQLGHADATTTLAWYAHYLPKATTRYVDILDEDDARHGTSSTGGGSSGSLAPTAPTSEEPTEDDEPLTAQASAGSSNAPSKIRTCDLLIRSFSSPLRPSRIVPHRSRFFLDLRRTDCYGPRAISTLRADLLLTRNRGRTL